MSLARRLDRLESAAGDGRACAADHGALVVAERTEDGRLWDRDGARPCYRCGGPTEPLRIVIETVPDRSPPDALTPAP